MCEDLSEAPRMKSWALQPVHQMQPGLPGPPEVPRHLSPEIVTIDTPTDINTHKAADAAENESCHDANSGPNPPANPA
jgi:hypothetical protein